MSGTDPDQDPLTYEIVSNPAHGITNVSGNEVVYIPASNYFGPDVFAFTVSTDEDVAISIFLAGIDPDGDSLTYALGSNPSSGSASLSGSTVTYTPAANYNGTDSFTFTVSDGMATSEIAEVQIAITAVNDLPVLENITVTSSDVVYIYGSPSRCILTAEYFSLFLFC